MGSNSPEWKLFLWLKQKQSNWDFLENCLDPAAAERLEASVSAGLLLDVPSGYTCDQVFCGTGPSKQAETPTRFHRLSRDTNTFQSSPRKTRLVLALLRSSTSAAKTTLPRSPSTAAVRGTDPCASLREHLRCWVFLWLQNTLPDATEGFLDSCFISVIPARICRHLIPNQLHTARAMQGYTYGV